MFISECSFKTIVLIGDLFVFGNWTDDNYEGEDIIQELDQNNQIVATYTHGSGIDEPILVEKNGQKYYYISNGLGSITALVDSSGNVVQTYKFDSFGNIISQTGSLSQPFTYTGREYDSETGLFYYRHRYYDARTGRFLQEDPIGFAGGINFYSYVRNNPLNLIDPYGLFSFDTNEFGRLVEERRFSNNFFTGANLTNAGVNSFMRYPRSGIGGNPAGYPSTWLSKLGSYVPINIPFRVRVFGTRNALRALGRLSNLPIIFEGFYDWGVIIGSAWDAMIFDDCRKGTK